VTVPGINIHAVVDNRVFNALHLAVMARKLAVVQYLLTSNLGLDVEARDQDGRSALHLAVLCFHAEIARWLLENGANVNARDNHGNTPLHSFAATTELEFARELIQHGADLVATDNDGKTAFDRANMSGRRGAVAVANYILTSAYKDQVVALDGDRAIHAILEDAQYRYLVEAPVQQQQRQRQTLQIQLPVGKLTVDQFRALLRSFNGNRMRQRDTNTGATPFHVACRSAAPVEILELLWELYPDAGNSADNSGSLPLHCACQADVPSLAVLRFLLERNPAAVRALDNSGALPLHRLCRRANPDDNAVRLLLAEYEGSVSVRTNNGDLPFTVACKSRASPSAVLILLKANPDALQGFYSPK